jgi:hypothetical protein
VKPLKVKMITLDAGPEGVKHPGKTYDVDPEEGKALVDGGYATLVSEPTSQLSESDPIDFEDIEDIESFAELKADEQKKCLKHFEIEGDDSNGEKRVALFTAYLSKKTAANAEVVPDIQNAGDLNESETGNSSDSGAGDLNGDQSVPEA